MAILKLTSYIRVYRKKSGLTLREAAYLLGISHADLSRYETRVREVPLPVAFCCCLLYGFAVPQAFAGMYDLCATLLARRLRLFRNRLGRRISKSGPSDSLTHKLSWVTARLAHFVDSNPMKHSSSTLDRILALDLHPRSFGYAVFENADLLDWGLRKWPSRQLKTADRKLCRLIALWRPMRLIVREGAPRREYVMVEALARDAKVPVLDVTRAIVQDAFRSSKRASRFDVARAVAERYPKLGQRLPAARQTGHAEPFRLRMFNAAAIGMAFLHISNHTVDGGEK
jgi:transcriptional regulator with XRE-family HTH domain